MLLLQCGHVKPSHSIKWALDEQCLHTGTLLISELMLPGRATVYSSIVEQLLQTIATFEEYGPTSFPTLLTHSNLQDRQANLYLGIARLLICFLSEWQHA